MKKLKTKLLIAGAAMIFLSTQAQNVYAGSATANMTVSSTVIPSCTVSVTNLSFGSYTGSALPGTATISPTCTNLTTYNVGIGAGNGNGATVNARKMTNGASASTLNYSLLQSLGGSNWGNTVGSDTVSKIGDGTTQTLTVFGTIPASQTSPVGSYSDTVVVTITF